MSYPDRNSALSILLLCDDHSRMANTVHDHITALTRFSRHKVCTFNTLGIRTNRWLDLNEFDVVVLHYSLRITSHLDLARHFRELLRRFQGLKVQFLQDEYRWVVPATGVMRDLGIHVLFTLLTQPRAEHLYNQTRLPGVTKVHTMAGYVPENLSQTIVPSVRSRTIDVGYRGRTLPFWLGKLAQEKIWIGQGVLERASTYGLRCDIAWAEKDRIYGDRWNRFLANCRATLGTESGASITDFDGSIQRKAKAYLAEHPYAGFQEVHARILAPYENNFPITAVSPRVFEAAALRTALIMFPGEYSGILQPWIHYVPLARDFSNMDDVVEKVRDDDFLQTLTERTYQDLVGSGRYSQRTFANEFDEVVSKYATFRGKSTKNRFYLARCTRPIGAARYRVGVWARPATRACEDVIKATLALGILMCQRSGRRITWQYIQRPSLRKAAPFNRLLRDVLKLAVIGRVRNVTEEPGTPYKVAVYLDERAGRLRIESQPIQDTTLEASDDRSPVEQACWLALMEALQRRAVRTMVWNHSIIGGPVRYRLTKTTGLTVRVGDDDFHSFEKLLKVVEFMPEEASMFIASLLSASSADRRDHPQPRPY